MSKNLELIKYNKINNESSFWTRLANNLVRDKFFVLLIAPVVVYLIIFSYIPMYGILIAFKDYSAKDGILGSPWVGFAHFRSYFEGAYFMRTLRNTVLINLYSLFWKSPVPIIFALLLNEYRDGWFKKVTQTISYLPHFISTVVIVGMIVNFLSPINGIVNNLIQALGFSKIDFLNKPDWFRTILISSNVWQSFGYASIVYLSAMAGISPELYEAARIDGANRWKQMWHVTVPGILPTVIVIYLLNIGSMLNSDTGKILLMYNPATYETSDVIGTYIYRTGIMKAEFGYGTAVGLFNSLANMFLLIFANKTMRKLTELSLW